jgi:hypothetical protein
MKNLLDVRLHALKAVDATLAALQTTFSQPNLLGDGNDFRYIDGDAENSKVWVCDPDSRDGYDRTGSRMIVMVSRGEFQPMNMHLHNQGQGGFTEEKQPFTDLGRTPIFIKCEAGNKIHSEILASIVYQVLKFFRRDLMKELDIFELEVVSVSAPIQLKGVQGEPWQTVVSLRVETQEMFQISTITNSMNKFELVATIKKKAADLASFDTSPAAAIPIGEIVVPTP